MILTHGPRSVGKTTLLREFAGIAGVEVIDLDDPAVVEAARANPNAIVRGPTPVCVDEYQKVPELLDSLKTRLNEEGAITGTAVLTGSTRHDALPTTAQALTGRLHVLTILPLSQGEIDGERENLLAELFTDPEAAVLAHPASSTSRGEYIDRVCAGGFPLALRRERPARDRWFEDYIRLSIERDATELSRVRQRQALGDLLERLAAQTGQVLNVARASEGLKVERKTVDHHLRLLQDLFLVSRLPAWGKSLRARSTRSPKIHVVDSGLAAWLLRINEAKLATLDPTTLTEFGNLLETFVVGELRKQASWLTEAVHLGHWRTADGDEVDLVLERSDGAVLAVEVKAGERVSGHDFSALRKLRESLGERFIAGVAMSTGPRSYTYEDRLHVLPIDRLWRPI